MSAAPDLAGQRLEALCAEWRHTGAPLLHREILLSWRTWRRAARRAGLRAPPFLVLLP